jgi:hypothetical protein
MAQDGFDSLAYTDVAGYKNVIVHDPFPVLAVCRVTMSKIEVIELSVQLDIDVPLDFKTVEAQYDRPCHNILPCDPVRELHDRELLYTDDRSEDNALETSQYLHGTLLEGFQIQADQLLEGIGFGGKIPLNVEINLTEKLQFANQDAPPFAGIEMIKTIAQSVDTALTELLFAAEYYQHDKTRSRQYFHEYLNMMRK